MDNSTPLGILVIEGVEYLVSVTSKEHAVTYNLVPSENGVKISIASNASRPNDVDQLQGTEARAFLVEELKFLVEELKLIKAKLTPPSVTMEDITEAFRKIEEHDARLLEDFDDDEGEEWKNGPDQGS